MEQLLYQLGHLDRGKRENAVKGLAAFGEEAIAPLINYLQNEHNLGRNLAVRVLGMLASPRALPALTEALHDGDEVVRSVAAWAIGQIGDSTAIPALLEATEDRKHCVRTRATASLKMLGHAMEITIGADEQIIRHHAQALRSRPAFVRDQAYQSLLKIGTPAVPALLTILTALEPWARQLAAEALGEIGDTSVRDALLNTQDYDREASVRQAARLALQKLST